MSDTEKVHVKLGISGTYWDNRPQYRVLANDLVVKEASIQLDSDKIEYIEFDFEYKSDPCLSIELLNKSQNDTVLGTDRITIEKDMLLNIVSIEIDEIDLGHLLYQLGVYTTKETVTYNGETTNTVKNCTNLGWNGVWQLRWTCPFYIWLLEHI